MDVGAGTGMATARLHARGADVIAVEPGDGMAAEFRRALPDVPVVRGNGNALSPRRPLRRPAHLRPGLALDRPRSCRPGGVLALWWNTNALDVPWETYDVVLLLATTPSAPTA